MKKKNDIYPSVFWIHFRNMKLMIDIGRPYRREPNVIDFFHRAQKCGIHSFTSDTDEKPPL